MKIFVRILLGLIFLFFVAFAVFLLFGLMTPVEYEGSIGKEINVSQSQLWHKLNDIESLPTNRAEVKAVEIIEESKGGVDKWKEYLGGGRFIVLENIERIPNSKKTVVVRQTNIGLYGQWTYEIEDRGANRSFVRISEKSEVKSPLLRSVLLLKGRDFLLNEDLNFLER